MAAASATPEPKVLLVDYQAPRKVIARGGDLVALLKQRGFNFHLAKGADEFPRSCGRGKHIHLHYKEVAPGFRELSREQLAEALRQEKLQPACGCEFLESLVEGEIPADVTFVSIIKRAEKAGDRDIMCAACDGTIHTFQSSGGLRGEPRAKMVIVCVPIAQSSK